MKRYFHIQYFQFLLEMTKTEIKLRYKNAIFGLVWLLAPPLLQVAVIGFIFQYFINIPVDNYYLFLLSGILPWGFVTGAVSKATESVVNERDIVHKASFPREIIPLSIILSHAFHLIVAVGIVLVFAVGYNLPTLEFTFIIAFISPGILWLVCLSAGIALLVSSLQVRFRDIKFFIQMAIMVLFYATPILYSWTSLPPNLHRYFALNPFTTPFEMLRMGLVAATMPPGPVIVDNLLISLAIIWLGIVVFRRQSPTMSDWI